MRNAVWLLLVAVLAAGCLWLGEETVVDVPEERTWHLSSDVIVQEGFCGDCHYGLTEMWRTQWAEQDGNWSLQVSPRFAEAPLYAIHVGSGVVGVQPWLSEDWRLGDTYTRSFDVSEDASWLVFKAYGSGPDDPATATTASRRDVVETSLRLIAPDGQRFEADGPETDLRILVVPAQAGTWRAEVGFVDAALPTGRVSTYGEALWGETVPMLAWGEDATFTFPANETGAPPQVTLSLQPHHDHAAFQNSEWDMMDSTRFEVTFTPAAGPAPVLRTWNATEIDALWDGDEYRFHTMSGSMRAVYLDEPGHNDAGIGSGYPGFQGPDGDPVLPGTRAVRFELTWSPPTEEPALGIKFSPANWPYFLVPDATMREPGRAVFEARIVETWWEDPEQTLEWYEPGVVRSYYDIAPFIREDGELHAVALDYELQAYALR